jgi:hypothetical protein
MCSLRNMKRKEIDMGICHEEVVLLLFLAVVLLSNIASAKPPNKTRAKFYNFSEQLIDGEIKKPTALYTDSRGKVKFERLLKLKKSFIENLFKTAKEKVFK